MPQVSVIIPAYNAERSINTAIQSALAQTLRDIEVVVVDDCSVDDTAARVRGVAEMDARVRLVRAPVNGGPGRARDLGIAVAAGTWIAPLDADDRFRPERLERLLAIAGSHEAEMAADNLLLVSDTAGSATTRMLAHSDIPEPPLLDAHRFVEGNMGGTRQRRRFGYGYLKPIMRRDFLTRSGVRYGAGRLAEDYVFYLRCLLAGARWVVTNEAWYEYIVLADWLTTNHSEADLVHLRDAERTLLGDARVQRDPVTLASLRRHLRSVDLALSWFRFAGALKRHDPLGALRGTGGNPRHLAHIGAESIRALPRAMRKVGLSRGG